MNLNPMAVFEGSVSAVSLCSWRVQGLRASLVSFSPVRLEIRDKMGLCCWVYVRAFALCVLVKALLALVCVCVCVYLLVWIRGLALLLAGPASKTSSSCICQTKMGEALVSENTPLGSRGQVGEIPCSNIGWVPLLLKKSPCNNAKIPS